MVKMNPFSAITARMMVHTLCTNYQFFKFLGYPIAFPLQHLFHFSSIYSATKTNKKMKLNFENHSTEEDLGSIPKRPLNF